MDFKELILKRESCRAYADKPVEREKLIQIAEAGRLAPSACNSQPWFFTVAVSEEAVQKAADCVQHMGRNPFASQAKAFIIVTEEQAALSPRVKDFFPSQHFAPLDVGIAVAHMALAASDLGLSTCIMGWFDEEKVWEVFPELKGRTVRLILSVGYAATDAVRPKTRKAPEEIYRFV